MNRQLPTPQNALGEQDSIDRDDTSVELYRMGAGGLCLQRSAKVALESVMLFGHGPAGCGAAAKNTNNGYAFSKLHRWIETRATISNELLRRLLGRDAGGRDWQNSYAGSR